MSIICANCGCELDENDIYTMGDTIMCEDCYCFGALFDCEHLNGTFGIFLSRCFMLIIIVINKL